MSNKSNNRLSSAEYAYERKSTKNSKKIILISWVIILALLFAFWGISCLLEKIDDNLSSNAPMYDPNAQTIIFHEINYNENIFNDSAYIDLDRNIYIYDLNTGITESLEEEDFSSYGKDVKFMANFVEYIVLGDAESYNNCFDEDYYSDIDNTPKESFTMQKLYNIKLTKISEEKSSSGEYNEYTYYLEYMIYQNNGSFRMDIGSDASVAQYITITDKYGELKIQKLLRSYYQ